ncbi:hypothetical protein EON64_07115 [archaeon]|nr:MAG: hypothetical protein EON64_07115 [archaeon]
MIVEKLKENQIKEFLYLLLGHYRLAYTVLCTNATLLRMKLQIFFPLLLVLLVFSCYSGFRLKPCSSSSATSLYSLRGRRGGGHKWGSGSGPSDRGHPPTSPSSGSSGAPRRSEDSPSKSIRRLRYARILRDELAGVLANYEMQAAVYPPDELLDGVTISQIEVTGDLERAKVHVTVHGNSLERVRVFVWLNGHVGQIRYALAQRLRHMRRVPLLSFALVDSQSAALFSQAMEDISQAMQPSRLIEEMDFEEE